MTNHVAAVKQFLRDRTTSQGLITGYPFVTISREAGAGGHTVAREILRSLERKFSFEAAQDWEVFDQKMCALLADNPETGATFEALLAEEYHSEIRDFIGDLVSGQPRQYKLYKRIFEVVRFLANIGKVVLVGRAGAFVSADLPYGVHIRLVAREEVRIARMAKMLEVNEAEARKAVRAQDRSRTRMVRDYFDANVADPVHYHAVFNTERIPVPQIADMVTDLVGEQIKLMRSRKR